MWIKRKADRLSRQVSLVREVAEHPFLSPQQLRKVLLRLGRRFEFRFQLQHRAFHVPVCSVVVQASEVVARAASKCAGTPPCLSGSEMVFRELVESFSVVIGGRGSVQETASSVSQHAAGQVSTPEDEDPTGPPRDGAHRSFKSARRSSQTLLPALTLPMTVSYPLRPQSSSTSSGSRPRLFRLLWPSVQNALTKSYRSGDVSVGGWYAPEAPPPPPPEVERCRPCDADRCWCAGDCIACSSSLIARRFKHEPGLCSLVSSLRESQTWQLARNHKKSARRCTCACIRKIHFNLQQQHNKSSTTVIE